MAGAMGSSGSGSSSILRIRDDRSAGRRLFRQGGGSFSHWKAREARKPRETLKKRLLQKSEGIFFRTNFRVKSVRGIFRFFGGFFWGGGGGGRKNSTKNPQQNSKQNLGASRPKSTLQGPGL